MLSYVDTLAVLDDAAQSADVSRHLVRAVAWIESRWDPDALSSAGARGMLQLMPEPRGPHVEDDSVEANANAGAKYLAHLLRRFKGNQQRAVAAYNRGAGWVDKHPDPKGWPPKLRAYVVGIQRATVTGITHEMFAAGRPAALPAGEQEHVAEVIDMKGGDRPRVDAPGAVPLSSSRSSCGPQQGVDHAS